MSVPAIRQLDGETQFGRGVDSNNPTDLPEGFYLRSINMVNRGRVLQTRPGYRWIATLPDGQLQGLTFLRPLRSAPQLVAVVAGTVYRSYAPYEEFEELEGLVFSSTAPAVYFAQATKSVRRNSDGSVSFVAPVATLLIQDGINAPAYYDGTDFAHIRGAKTTPVGTVMSWSGDRLWVANGNRIYVSDISDPYSFYEDTYNTLGGRQSFTVVGDVTGMAETPGSAAPQLLVFTDRQTVAFKSNVRERSSWPSLDDFQTTLFPLGCVSHRSLVTQHGMLYWMSPQGLVSFDSAALSLQSSELGIQDNEMAWSKARLNGYLAGIAGGSHENYLLMSVPHADNFNPHTWVLDFSIRARLNDAQPKAWSSVWTGTRPVEWVSAEINGVPRIFQASRDADGKNRIWEAFTSERRDEFCDIDWAVETRAYTEGNISQKEFRWAEIALSDLQGAVDISVKFAGVTKGRWIEILNNRFFANEGNIFAAQDMPDKVFALKKQVRLVRTQDVRDMELPEPTGCGVETNRLEKRDIGFQLCIRGSGPVAINSARVFQDAVAEEDNGACHTSEESGHYVRMDGSASTVLSELAALCDTCGTYTGVATVTATYGNTSITVTQTATSNISQDAADKLAEQRAWAEANLRLRREATPFTTEEPESTESEEGWDGKLDFSITIDSVYTPIVF